MRKLNGRYPRTQEIRDAIGKSKLGNQYARKIPIKYKICAICKNRKLVHLFKDEVPEGKNPILLFPTCDHWKTCKPQKSGNPSHFIHN